MLLNCNDSYGFVVAIYSSSFSHWKWLIKWTFFEGLVLAWMSGKGNNLNTTTIYIKNTFGFFESLMDLPLLVIIGLVINFHHLNLDCLLHVRNVWLTTVTSFVLYFGMWLRCSFYFWAHYTMPVFYRSCRSKAAMQAYICYIFRKKCMYFYDFDSHVALCLLCFFPIT